MANSRPAGRRRDAEPILHRAGREISLLVAGAGATVTEARYAPGEQVAGRHVHYDHSDVFYVLEGELTFEVGCEPKTISVSAGALVLAPPGVAHSFGTGGDTPARWLTIHAPDGGFAAFIRGLRDGLEPAWDIGPVPPDGGRPAAHAIVSLPAR